MRVIFANRKNCFTVRGGDTVQMLKTQESLSNIENFQSKICLKSNEILNSPNFDIVHIFNIQTIDETLEMIEASKKSGKAVALSTIYWNLSDNAFATTIFKYTKIPELIGLLRFLKPLILKMMEIKDDSKFRFRYHYANKLESSLIKRKKALQQADIILPNSVEELEILSREFKIDIDELMKKAVVIPNAVDINVNILEDFSIDSNKTSIGEIDNYVLCVGRIEVNKNQYNIVKALLKKPEIPIVFVGKVGSGAINSEYYRKLKKISKLRGNVYFVDQIPQEEVYKYYSKAKVHVLASFRESPGLSTLEAKYFDCEIVTSSKEFCPINYYKFDKIAHICNPYSVKSIRKAIIDAYEKPKKFLEKSEYFSFYSYENVAAKMADVYDNLISNKT